jgi:hypothetical protein
VLPLQFVQPGAHPLGPGGVRRLDRRDAVGQHFAPVRHRDGFQARAADVEADAVMHSMTDAGTPLTDGRDAACKHAG